MDLIIKAKLNPNDDLKTVVDIIVERPHPVEQLRKKGKMFSEVFGSVHVDLFWNKTGGSRLYKRIQEGGEVTFKLVEHNPSDGEF